jgi:hypothetical protein
MVRFELKYDVLSQFIRSDPFSQLYMIGTGSKIYGLREVAMLLSFDLRSVASFFSGGGWCTCKHSVNQIKMH